MIEKEKKKEKKKTLTRKMYIMYFIFLIWIIFPIEPSYFFLFKGEKIVYVRKTCSTHDLIVLLSLEHTYIKCLYKKIVTLIREKGESKRSSYIPVSYRRLNSDEGSSEQTKELFLERDFFEERFSANINWLKGNLRKKKLFQYANFLNDVMNSLFYLLSLTN